MARFEKVSAYADVNFNLPIRKTEGAAGYDFEVAEDIIIPSVNELWTKLPADFTFSSPLSLQDMAKLTKHYGIKPTLVPTGTKCYLDGGTYLELSVRSSTPLKYWLLLANGVGKLL